MASSLILIGIAFITLCPILESSAKQVCQQECKQVCKEVPTNFSKPEDCPSKLTRGPHLKVYNGKCYQFHTSLKTVIEASKFCHDAGGYLVTVKSKEVNDFIKNWRRSFNINEDMLIWIGLTRRGKKGFVWADGTSLEYKNFETENPFTDITHCIAMKRTGYWKGQFCETLSLLDYKNPFICEFRPEGITTTDPANMDEYRILLGQKEAMEAFPPKRRGK